MVADNACLEDEDRTFRRIPYNPHQIVRGSDGQYRPSSAAFKDHPNGTPMSIDIESKLHEHDLDEAFCLAGYEKTHALAAIQLREIRALGLGVTHEPLDDNPAHGHVHGEKVKKIRRSLSKSIEWIIFEPHMLPG